MYTYIAPKVRGSIFSRKLFWNNDPNSRYAFGMKPLFFKVIQNSKITAPMLTKKKRVKVNAPPNKFYLNLFKLSHKVKIRLIVGTIKHNLTRYLSRKKYLTLNKIRGNIKWIIQTSYLRLEPQSEVSHKRMWQMHLVLANQNIQDLK